ncbi:MAG TPA: hypothetical protein VG028_21215, partial [Terriglobia bacterium]|nr:hypothetical protein [Terriglobia bacterium]
STSVITPILQAEDGSYFGTETWNVVNSYYSSMQAFDLSGNVKWSVPGFTPVIATSDGGVIAKSTTGEYETFDQNGVANGMMASLPTYSWVANAYQDGPLNQVAAPTINFAPSFLAMLGGNDSLNGSSVQQTWFPRLPSCNDKNLNPPIACPGPDDAIHSAFTALKSFVISCQSCNSLVFQLLGTANQKEFYEFLSLPGGIYDGTRSNYPAKNMCNWGTWDGFMCSDIFNKETVANWFSENLGRSATTVMPSPAKQGPTIFFDPYFICKENSASNTGIWNQALLFHEALHGFYGLNDTSIQSALGLTVDPDNTSNITDYLDQKVFNRTNLGCGN